MGIKTKQFQTHEKLITFCLEEGMLKEYSAFLRLKTLYKNSVIYNFTHKKVAKLLKVSESTSKRYFKTLKIYGFLVVQKKATNKNLKLDSFSNILSLHCNISKAGHKCTIKIKPKYSIKDIEAVLVNKIIQQHGRNAMYQHKKQTSKPECSIPSPGKRFRPEKPKAQSHENGRVFVSLTRCMKLLNEYDQHFITGYRKLSQNMGFTISKLWSTVQRLKKLGLIAARDVKVLVREISLEDFNRLKPVMDKIYQGYQYFDNGCLMTNLGSIFNFSDYPVSDETIEFKYLNI